MRRLWYVLGMVALALGIVGYGILLTGSNTGLGCTAIGLLVLVVAGLIGLATAANPRQARPRDALLTMLAVYAGMPLVMALPFADNSFDRYTISFGIRNVTRIPDALAEAYRVLKPGGRLVVVGRISHLELREPWCAAHVPLQSRPSAAEPLWAAPRARPRRKAPAAARAPPAAAVRACSAGGSWCKMGHSAESTWVSFLAQTMMRVFLPVAARGGAKCRVPRTVLPVRAMSMSVPRRSEHRPTPAPNHNSMRQTTGVRMPCLC